MSVRVLESRCCRSPAWGPRILWAATLFPAVKDVAASRGQEESVLFPVREGARRKGRNVSFEMCHLQGAAGLYRSAEWPWDGGLRAEAGKASSCWVESAGDHRDFLS